MSPTTAQRVADLIGGPPRAGGTMVGGLPDVPASSQLARPDVLREAGELYQETLAHEEASDGGGGAEAAGARNYGTRVGSMPPTSSASPDPTLAALLAQNQAFLALLSRGPKRAGDADPLDFLFKGPVDVDDEEKVTGARGCAARHVVNEAHRRRPARVVEKIRSLLAESLGVDADELKPADLKNYFEKKVPLGNFRMLTYTAFGLAAVWEKLERKELDAAQSLVGLLAVFCEQVALEGGTHYQLGWLLTGLEPPPFSAVAQNKPVGDGLAHARLADPKWVAANLAYLRDMDLVAERTRRTHKGHGKGDKDKEKDKDA